jgi:hypothetical protein
MKNPDVGKLFTTHLAPDVWDITHNSTITKGKSFFGPLQEMPRRYPDKMADTLVAIFPRTPIRVPTTRTARLSKKNK